ncbi:uncharacterized protein A1O9_04386 [Exophiala aquamarina CBS 119918]|uniref:Ubiquitin 3 binding protein But2 C-terminal domain-containing protein n=1 Tax=Exophiala aquamarina CBS 119918 TaxID=1182545 RepID=A0A072PIF8_9EURO|nr:uncharacterized protein A1O9_04386 [Exophiala aquamarina CBS 119918]KEF59542.1 hypothetical protein A1O9_04386 [Exophiala aquamarina CBS 119918]
MYGDSIVALVAFALFANAAPLDARADPVSTLYPSYTSQYNYKTGAVTYKVPQGLVSRATNNGGADISTLVTFELDQKYAPNDCQLVFDLMNSSSSVGGSKKAQLYTALAPAYTSADSWPSGNLRDQHLGSINVVKDGRATWEAGSGPLAPEDGYFDCADIAGLIYGGEIVPQGDAVEIKWPAKFDGPKILVW